MALSAKTAPNEGGGSHGETWAGGVSTGKASSAPLVLVIEDDQDIASAIAQALTGVGYRVECVQSGEAALEVLKRGRVALVLLDWRLPGSLVGRELLLRLRAACRYRLAVVVVSGDTLALSEAESAGVEDYLPKPFNLADLIHVVDDYCR